MNKKCVVLPENRDECLEHLLNPPANPANPPGKKDAEIRNFTLYLNMAVINIQKITKISATNEQAFIKQLQEADESILVNLANFLWLFRVDEPNSIVIKNDKCGNLNVKELTLLLVKKIFALRNFFAHPEETHILPLLDSRDFYVLLEGILLDRARHYAVSLGISSDKLFKLKLMNQHSFISPRDILFERNKQYELTRKGLIFLTCMGLYKDDAEEFCQQFNDLKLPQRCPHSKLEECQNALCPEAGNQEKKCNYKKIKSLRAMFTCFSMRRGRTEINSANLDYMCFSDIITYLNKVPAASYNSLPLTEEKNRLQEISRNSTESEKNKEYKYILHKRFEDKFMSFAAAYCEDFNLLPSIRFKRLDMSNSLGRKRFCFGTENSDGNRNRMNRHYAVKNNTIGIEYIPTEHYGDIKIKAMHSAIGEDEFKKLLFIGNRLGFELVDRSLQKYFSSYHKILETMLNCTEIENIYDLSNDLDNDFYNVTGLSFDDLMDDWDTFNLFFQSNLARFFYGDSMELSQEECRENLIYRLRVLEKRAQNFKNKLKKLKSWQRATGDERGKPRPQVSDAELVKWVFNVFNLHLTTDRKFRQLPMNEQHNKGMKDYEFQMIHSAVGKYALDPKSIGTLLQEHLKRPELVPVMEALDKNVILLLQKEKSYRQKNGNPNQARKTLAMLAEAAVTYYIEYCEKEQAKWEKMSAYDVDLLTLQTECRKYGIKVGMPLERGALIKTILGIDLDKWSHAYNYAEHKPYENRILSREEHIVSQIPFVNGFANRLMSTARTNKNLKAFFTENENFDFGKGFRVLLNSSVHLRDYYNISYLIDIVRKCSEKGHIRNTIERLKKSIVRTYYQDKLLLFFAFDYRARALKNENALELKVKHEKGNSIYNYFDTPDAFERDGIKVYVFPNDITRPVFNMVYANIKKLALNTDPSRGEFEFYELVDTLRQIQIRDRNKRLEILPKIFSFEDSVKIPDSQIKNDKGDKAEREKQNRDFLYPYYREKYPQLTREEFDIVVEARNAVYHDHLDLNLEKANEILHKYLCRQRNV